MNDFQMFYLSSSYFSSTYCVLHTILGSGKIAVNKISKAPALCNLPLYSGKWVEQWEEQKINK